MELLVEKLKNAELALSFDDVLLLPRYSDVRLDEIDISTRIAPGLTLKIPIISSPMDTVTGREMVLSLGRLGGLGVLPRNLPLEEAFSVVREAVDEKIPVGVAVGPFDDERVGKLLDVGVSIIVVDTAHGHSRNVIEATKRYVALGAKVMAGNIVTGEAAEALIAAGASSLRVGVGPGHACTTREVAGVGRPQLSAIAEVADAARSYGVSVVADGGIEKPADAVKALAVGADAVMLGYLLAGTDEAPGALVVRDGKCFKVYRGMGSRSALASGSTRYGEFKRVPEGVEGLVECRGSVARVVEWITGGIRQGMGYVGARSLAELREKSVFVRLTGAGVRESGPRGLFEVRY
ncbi:IMP dehydrogenase [Infirmifilum lucidum]|uniref:IMP dehydrogenase n=1 Tax=Infirmifilum lucidum TaxID=2776706 RepID=A0A7L9FKD7_9CREN|nr:IMP dehydrogenase [Infirmifilum lucidum]QOJ79336.1 IMP dehydrogenase [Infirmifilum lucidum]